MGFETEISKEGEDKVYYSCSLGIYFSCQKYEMTWKIRSPHFNFLHTFQNPF